jgi:CubicO group peptidase (beta-lactamase class C family)
MGTERRFPMNDLHAWRSISISFVLFAVGLAPEQGPAQQLPSASPASQGLSAERLQRIDGMVAKSIAEKQIAGAVTLVMRHGKVVWLKPQGFLDREAGKPMVDDALFRICSMTKPITTVAVMMLYEEGRFQLEDPISKFIPEFKNPKVLVKPATGAPYTIPAAHEITIRDLLRHTSGLTYPWNADLGKMYQDANVATGLLQYDGTIADNVKAIAAQPLLFNPGDKFEYSLGVDVLGRLVEVVSGMPLDQFFRTRIFEPLGMRDTSFYPPDEKLGRLAVAYSYLEGKGLTRFPDKPIIEGTFSYSADYPYRGPKKLFSGGAGLVSTAEDYARFCQMFLDKGMANGKQLLSRKSIELMTHDQLGTAGTFGFGLGFGIDGAKGPLEELGSVGSYSWGGFFYTGFVIDPKEQMIVIFMAQLHPTGDTEIDKVVTTLAYQALLD